VKLGVLLPDLRKSVPILLEAVLSNGRRFVNVIRVQSLPGPLQSGHTSPYYPSLVAPESSGLIHCCPYSHKHKSHPLGLDKQESIIPALKARFSYQPSPPYSSTPLTGISAVCPAAQSYDSTLSHS
jgi:hypothetical protein